MPKGHTMSALLEGELNSATKEEVPSPVALSAPEIPLADFNLNSLERKLGQSSPAVISTWESP
jgi:hypothetical protein